METIKYKNHVINIVTDDDPENPRLDWDSAAKMVCWHSRYNLGNKHDFKTPDDFREFTKTENNILILPLYLYDHGGITISTKTNYPFNCQWDSMQIGYIYMTEKMILETYQVQTVTEAIRKKSIESMIAEIKIYDDYLTGSAYGFVVLDKDGIEIDSCYNYFGDDFKENGLLDEAHERIDEHITIETQKHFKQLKIWIKNKVPLQYRKSLIF